ncbi:MAG: hypothetical protein E4H20_07085 [Spirochaetales bacterium]|nr:MAG: hypothetical protein E4H20_07085 [Spirochaetales bacterium]
MTRSRRFLASVLVLATALPVHAQFKFDFSSPPAGEAFRNGVEAYNAGRYAESLLLFEQALGQAPGNPLGSYWLGKAYYRLGSAATAFDAWRRTLSAVGASPFLESRLELFEQASDPALALPALRYIRSSELAGKEGKDIRFLRPSWIEPLPDGSLLLVAHGSNEILHINVNGQIMRRMRGNSSGFDRPFSLAVLVDGTIIVSEFQADRLARLSSDGVILGYIGDTDGPGRLAGPQYVATDTDGFIYVSDVGHSRVVKFDSSGRYVLAFGTMNAEFPGLRLPTGVATGNGVVYVADAALKAVFEFDTYGNYLGVASRGILARPEGLRLMKDGLLLADTGRVVLLDPESGSVRELYRSERSNPRILSAAWDANGDLVVVDFDASELAYLSDPAIRYAGLSVEAIGIDSSRYPRVNVNVRVLDRAGRPVVGLSSSNFYLSQTVRITERRIEADRPVDYVTESISPAQGFAFDGSLDASTELSAIFLLEGSDTMVASIRQTRDILSEIHDAFGENSSAALVIAGALPQPAIRGNLVTLTSAILSAKASKEWRFDTGLRLAAGSLFVAGGRKAVVYLTSGSANEALLDETSVSELGALLANNGIVFYAVIVGTANVSPVLRYLAERTGGSVLNSDRPEGLASLASDIRSTKTGLYRLSFNSLANDGFGREYLALSVETYLRGRSGKDETGFFSRLR